MMKMEIKLDEERIKRDGEYTVEEFWGKIDEEFENACKKEIQSDGSVMYVGIPNKDYFTDISAGYMILSEWKPFARYCLKWIWYENEDVDDDEYNELMPFYADNLLEKERERNPLFEKWC